MSDKLKSFRLTHYEEFCVCAKEIKGALELVPFAKSLFLNGIIRAAFHETTCYSLHGVYPLHNGVADAWMISNGSLLRKFPTCAYRSAKLCLKEGFMLFNIHRIQMDVPTDFHMRWCESLGFTLEGIMRKYLNGEDRARFAIVH